MRWLCRTPAPVTSPFLSLTHIVPVARSPKPETPISRPQASNPKPQTLKNNLLLLFYYPRRLLKSDQFPETLNPKPGSRDPTCAKFAVYEVSPAGLGSTVSMRQAAQLRPQRALRGFFHFSLIEFCIPGPKSWTSQREMGTSPATQATSRSSRFQTRSCLEPCNLDFEPYPYQNPKGEQNVD